MLCSSARLQRPKRIGVSPRLKHSFPESTELGSASIQFAEDRFRQRAVSCHHTLSSIFMSRNTCP